MRGGDPCGRPGGGHIGLPCSENVSGREPRHPRAVQAPPPRIHHIPRPYWDETHFKYLVVKVVRTLGRFHHPPLLPWLHSCILLE
jgi:hypothetical protein